MGRFIVWSQYKGVGTEESRWLLHPSMTTQLDYRSGQIIPNEWFPHWVELDFMHGVRRIDGSVLDIPATLVKVRRWCDKHCEGDVVAYTEQHCILGFELNTDAMAFNMTWQDIVLNQGSL